MNWHRKSWEKKRKRNPVAKELQEFTPKIIPSKKHTKLTSKQLKDLLNDPDSDLRTD